MTQKTIHVVAAVIKNTDGKVLIAKRPQHVHQGGLWEFPGGKVEINETTDAALQRELFEELNIQVTNSQALIQIHHNYPDKSVFLDVFNVNAFNGTAKGNEGQEIRWVDKKQLSDFEFPAANKPIIDAVILPHEYLITPEYDFSDRGLFLAQLESNLIAGIKLVQLRAKSLSDTDFAELYKQTLEITERHNASLHINASLETATKLNARGVHLTASHLLNTSTLPANLTVSASCHNETEILKACELGINFIVLSPVQYTASHPDSAPLGWQKFAQLCLRSTVPVFALGGMKRSDTSTAMSHGAQGIAAISSLWYAPKTVQNP